MPQSDRKAEQEYSPLGLMHHRVRDSHGQYRRM